MPMKVLLLPSFPTPPPPVASIDVQLALTKGFEPLYLQAEAVIIADMSKPCSNTDIGQAQPTVLGCNLVHVDKCKPTVQISDVVLMPLVKTLGSKRYVCMQTQQQLHLTRCEVMRHTPVPTPVKIPCNVLQSNSQ